MSLGRITEGNLVLLTLSLPFFPLLAYTLTQILSFLLDLDIDGLSDLASKLYPVGGRGGVEDESRFQVDMKKLNALQCNGCTDWKSSGDDIKLVVQYEA